ncbi:MAG: sulfatase-like hydrolase/transferase [Phycisphaerae bacterium]|nr:sulfatase-like hydrolase/transferase [Phycisphaerae bacterium]
MEKTEKKNDHLWIYFLLTYIAVLVNMSGYMGNIRFTDSIVVLFTLSVWICYGAVYMVPILVVMVCGQWLKATTTVKKRLIFYSLLVLMASLVQIFIFADKTIFRMYDFHINGFVWNLITTEGGLESLGGSSSSTWTFTAIISGFIILQGLLLLLVVVKKGNLLRFLSSRMSKRIVILLSVIIGIAALFQGVTYGVCSYSYRYPILVASKSFPMYLPITFRHILDNLGFEPAQKEQIKFRQRNFTGLNYPLKAIDTKPDAKQYNVVWLVAESLRADMVDADIMPQTYKFAQQSCWFQNHYSSGNGTRMGLFSMFYGLYGSYWFDFLNEQRGPVLIDLLLNNHYQMSMYSSAKFSYPEFDRNIFARIPTEKLHDGLKGPGWQRDRENVTDMLSFIDGRDVDKPFMTFMFFESPHARYYFPPENIIREPYLENFNYATADLEKDMPLIKNRYINSCNHLDSQFDRIFKYLAEKKLLDSTVVIVTGDHGEEFMEKGHWGHNSRFNQEQTQVPLILLSPGKVPQKISRMTSHLDIPATLMTILGVKNDPADYSLGYDLYGDHLRQYTIFADWDKLGYADNQYKAVFPLKGYGFLDQQITTADDEQVSDNEQFYDTHRDVLLDIMKDMSRFIWK